MADKKKYALIGAVTLFALTQAVLGWGVQVTGGRTNAWVCYSVIILAFLFSVMGFLPCFGRGDILITAGLTFTLAADWCLVIEEPILPLIAMVFFNGAQLCYAAAVYCRQRSRVEKTVHIWLRVGLSATAVAVVFAILGRGADALSVISVVYYVNLLLNCLLSFLQGRRGALLGLGFLLFALCDVFVGLDNLDMYFTIARDSLIWRLTHNGLNMAWIFYVPSQAMIAICGATAEKRKSIFLTEI